MRIGLLTALCEQDSSPRCANRTPHRAVRIGDGGTPTRRAHRGRARSRFIQARPASGSAAASERLPSALERPWVERCTPKLVTSKILTGRSTGISAAQGVNQEVPALVEPPVRARFLNTTGRSTGISAAQGVNQEVPALVEPPVRARFLNATGRSTGISAAQGALVEPSGVNDGCISGVNQV